MQMMRIHAGLLMFDNNGLGAESLLKEALAYAATRLSDHSKLVISLKISLARALTMQSKFNQAHKVTQELFASANLYGGLSHHEISPIISQHAFLLSSMGKHRESAAEYQRVLDIETDYYSADHPRVLHGKSNLADSLLEAGEIDRAIEQYSELVRFDTTRDQINPVRLSSLKLRLSNALLKANQPAKAYGEIQQVADMLAGQTEVPNWMEYTLGSLHGAALIELGQCDEGLKLINQTVEQIFLDSVSDSRITSKIYARQAHYQASSMCA